MLKATKRSIETGRETDVKSKCNQKLANSETKLTTPSRDLFTQLVHPIPP